MILSELRHENNCYWPNLGMKITVIGREITNYSVPLA